MAMIFPSISQLYLIRWITEAWTRIQTRNPKINENNNNGIEEIGSRECYACSKEGNPIFHSTSCDSYHQPEWQAYAGSHLFPTQCQNDPDRKNRLQRSTSSRLLGPLLDPRSGLVQKWNRVLLVARGVALVTDPVFFYAFSLHVAEDGIPCLYLNAKMAMILITIRSFVDGLNMCHVWLQFRLAYVSRETMVIGCGKLVWDRRAIAMHYLRSLRGFWFDVFVILPIPQALFWLVIPSLISEGRFKLILNLLLLMILFQFLPKVYHSLCLMSRMRKVTGYIFGSIWWGFTVNLLAYLMFSHVVGGCWYALATQRVVNCLEQQCEKSNCNISLSCSNAYYQTPLTKDTNKTMLRQSLCLDDDGPFQYGIYGEAIPVIYSNSISNIILYPIFWGLLNLSSFGNELEPSTNLVEVVFSICIVICGFALFTLLIGHIQICLEILTARRVKIQLRRRDIEWWMRRRQLPSRLRKRVRKFECQRCDTMGEDELNWIDELPDGLRREIKRYLCLDLIKKVPLFQCLGDLILDNICDRVKPLIYSKDETIIREGDPIQKMVFVVHGRIKRSQKLSKGKLGTSVIEPGGFLGDELLSWCLRCPFSDRLPASSASFTCIEPIEGFLLKANDLRYITDHFRYKFASKSLKYTARYYSSNWRTWGAVVIQLAWRRYKKRKIRLSYESMGDRDIFDMRDGGIEAMLRRYAFTFMSFRPHDHLE